MSTSGKGLSSAAIEQLIAQCLAEVMAAYKANQNNQNRYGNPNVNARGLVPIDHECTYQHFMKCQPHNFKGTEGVVGLARWFERMETNSYKRTIRTDVAYAMTWKALIKLMTELILLCTKMVPEEEDQVKKFIGGLPDNIQGNVITAKPTRLQDAIRIANNLMDQKLKGYAAKDAKNKRMSNNDPRDNHVQQPPLKRYTKRYCPELRNVNGDGEALQNLDFVMAMSP
uniref:Reverse transcriptase domain-containing protein n=1 Tax=Tanacetum cinerariifolium TaxID=118510 RepID=A0A699HJA2_TANCI|nr:hypothetical protein [Tanacetum cinerariifolium]